MADHRTFTIDGPTLTVVPASDVSRGTSSPQPQTSASQWPIPTRGQISCASPTRCSAPGRSD